VNGPGPFDTVLVTGAGGFIGACAVRSLLARGHSVHAVHRPGTDPWRLAGLRGAAHCHALDLGDADGVATLLQTVRPQAVLHLAAHGAYESQTDFREMLTSNVLATYHLLEISAGVGVRAFVNTGSSSEYGYKSEPMREADRVEPNSLYAVAKAAQTHLCQLLGRRLGMGTASFRLFSVFGPWEAPTRLVPTLIQRARADLPLEMVAPWVARDFVYVEDVLEALLDFPRVSELRGAVINLGTGVETTLSQVVTEVLELTGSRSEVHWGAMAARQWDTNRWVADPTEAARLLGWHPTHSLREGLVKMTAWIEATGEGYGCRPTRVAG
jgi:UDP-glucose 4-epimerase